MGAWLHVASDVSSKRRHICYRVIWFEDAQATYLLMIPQCLVSGKAVCASPLFNLRAVYPADIT